MIDSGDDSGESGKVSYGEFVALVRHLRGGISLPVARAEGRALLEKMFDRDDRPEAFKADVHAATQRPVIPIQVASREAQELARLPEHEAQARLAKLLGVKDPEQYWANVKKFSETPLSNKDYHRLATAQVDSLRRNPRNQKLPRGRESLWAVGRDTYEVSYAWSATTTNDSAFGLGFERFLRESKADGEDKERMWALLNAPSTQHYMWALARWYEQACPIVHFTRPDYAASLAATSIVPEEPILPWRAVLLELPERVVPYEGSWIKFVLVQRVVMGDAPATWTIVLMPERAGVPTIWSHGQQWSVWSAEDPDPESEVQAFRDPTLKAYGDETLNDLDGRVLLICRRIVSGACCAMSTPDDWRPTKSADVSTEAARRRLQKEPACRVYLLGRPVKIDCRLAVKQYVEQGTSKGPLTLQMLVRGHWRRQAIGVGRSERKWIRIEPYWKGPEDAPIRTPNKKL